jgi:hypothetical protein
MERRYSNNLEGRSQHGGCGRSLEFGRLGTHPSGYRSLKGALTRLRVVRDRRLLFLPHASTVAYAIAHVGCVLMEEADGSVASCWDFLRGEVVTASAGDEDRSSARCCVEIEAGINSEG